MQIRSFMRSFLTRVFGIIVTPFVVLSAFVAMTFSLLLVLTVAIFYFLFLSDEKLEKMINRKKDEVKRKTG